MTTSKAKRKLTTIYCADVQSYSTLMAHDEAAALERLQRYRAIMDELFTKYEGRKVNTWGDAVIAEFPSVVEAVRCAVEVQDAIGAENRDLPDNRQMWFRIGINLGDVMQDGDDLYGDGVNVASRLESLADPGGIMVSETVYELTRKQLTFGYEFAGEKKVKGGDGPIVGYRVRMPGSNHPPEETADEEQAPGEEHPEFEHAGRGHSFHDHRSVPMNQLVERLERFRDWFSNQPRRVRFSVGMIGFFFAINLLFSGLATPWFIFPSLPFALHILMSMRSRKG